MSDARDRLAEGRQPDFDIDREYGSQGELFVASIVTTMQDGSIEVKHDAVARRTGNLYLEFQCKGRPSGLSVTTSELWAHVVNNVAIVAPTARVKALSRIYYRDGRIREEVDGTHPTRGIVVPVGKFVWDLMRVDVP